MLTIYRSEGSASLRRVPIWLVGSNGTAPATGEAGGQPQITWHPRGTATVNTSGTLSLVSANAGLYHVELTASEVSALGVFSVHYRSANAIAQTVFGKIVNYDSGDSVRFGQFALPNAAAEAAGGLLTFGTGTGQIHTSTGSVGLKEITYSGVTILGVQRADVGYISGDAVAADNLESAFDGVGYSSAMTVLGVTRVDSSVTLRAATHSGATVQGISNYANISNVTLHAGTHSNVTIQGVTRVNSSVTIVDAEYSAVTVNISTSQWTSITSTVWDRVLTGSTHNVASSAGRRVRQLAGFVAADGTAQAGAASSISLAAGNSAETNLYAGGVVSLVGGTGVGQSRQIVQYDGATRTAWVQRPWITNPDSTTDFVVVASSQPARTDDGLAQGAAASTISLANTASSITSTYLGQKVVIFGGTGAGQSRIITGYDGATRTARINQDWITTPDTTSIYVVFPTGRSQVVDILARSYSGVTIAGVSFVGTAGERSIASSWMSTNLGQNRYAQEAIFALRNRVQISGSTGTVFHPDDTTSAWTFSVTTGTSPLAGIDPGGL